MPRPADRPSQPHPPDAREGEQETQHVDEKQDRPLVVPRVDVGTLAVQDRLCDDEERSRVPARNGLESRTRRKQDDRSRRQAGDARDSAERERGKGVSKQRDRTETPTFTGGSAVYIHAP